MKQIKRYIQDTFKKIGYLIFKIVYGNVNLKIVSQDNKFKILALKFENKKYSLFRCFNSRLYTDTINNTAFIRDNKIIEKPSFQYSENIFCEVEKNNILNTGTPKVLKKIDGTVFSLLTGGGGNNNYWHWLFDVLPRINLIKNTINSKDIDYFLFPNLEENFQNESLDLLNIPNIKRLSSKKFRHIYANEIISTTHPYVFSNNPSVDCLDLPTWIMKFLRDSFLDKKSVKDFTKKFYIDRSDAKSNHSHLRRISNEDEVKDVLKKRNFSVIKLSDLKFEDQINLFSNAKQIVGLHGAGFANLVFCNPKTSVLELKPIGAGKLFENLSKKMNLNYNDISSETLNKSNNDQQGIIKVPIELLEKKLG